MKNSPYFLLIFLFLLAMSSCEDDHLRKDMIQFDRAFIPVFYYTTLGNFKAAETAMYPLMAKWQHYQNKDHLQNQESEDWRETIRLLGSWLDQANCALQEKNAEVALIHLDHARYELVDLRFRANMDDYYLDYVWDLETLMYTAIETATNPMVDLLEFNEFELLSEEVGKAWIEVMERPIDEGLFVCTPDQWRYVNFQKEKLGMAVASLLSTVDTADRCQFAEAAMAIEPAYLNYLGMFGDFEGAESFYAVKR